MESQRDVFFSRLFELAKEDDRIVLVTADCGASSLDKWRGELPCQFINVGIAEQQLIMMAAGLALAGKRPYCYAIAPFATLRCVEFVKVDLCLMQLPVVIVGVGAGLSYSEAGPTHHATEDIAVMRALPYIQIASVRNNIDAYYLAHVYDKPTYIRLDRQSPANPPKVVFVTKSGCVFYIPLWLKPFSMPPICDVDEIITVEEHLPSGGLGSIVAEYLADNDIRIPLKRIGLKDEYYYKYGTRADIWDSEAALAEYLGKHYKKETRDNITAWAEPKVSQ